MNLVNFSTFAKKFSPVTLKIKGHHNLRQIVDNREMIIAAISDTTAYVFKRINHLVQKISGAVFARPAETPHLPTYNRHKSIHADSHTMNQTFPPKCSFAYCSHACISRSAKYHQVNNLSGVTYFGRFSYF